jgi:hypothetical protein
VRATIFPIEKQLSITDSVALDIQLAKRMRHIVICGPSGYIVVSILSHKRQDI